MANLDWTYILGGGKKKLGSDLHFTQWRFADEAKRRFDYAYNSVNDITAVQRDSAEGDAFQYDLTQQITRYAQNGNVDLSNGTISTPTTDTNLAFDGCGNRTNINGASSSYNNMNQPTDAGITYDTNGNLITYNGYVYNYDAQNRLRTVVNSNNIAIAQFYYDGLNRQVARNIRPITSIPLPPLPSPIGYIISGSVNYTIFSVWDGDWAILEEYGPSNVLVQKYLQGYHGLVKTLQDNIYYYQDELGSTSHIASSTGALLEYYKYDLYGRPTYFSSTSQPLNSSTYAVKDLFTGQRWVPEIGLYDDRNRFMSPDLGRFLQPDPIGFKGDSSNLYRYCGNDWANRNDPMGLNGDQDRSGAPILSQGPNAWTPPGDCSQKIEAMELRNTAYAPTANAVERQTQRQEAKAAFSAEAQRAIADGPRLAQVGGAAQRQGSTATVSKHNQQIIVTLPNGQRLIYPAGNNTHNSRGDPNRVGSNGPAPNGTFPVQRPVMTGNSPSYGPMEYPIGGRDRNGNPTDIARQRGIGLHGGRDSYQDPTHGCIRMNNRDIRDLYNRTQNAPLQAITIGD